MSLDPPQPPPRRSVSPELWEGPTVCFTRFDDRADDNRLPVGVLLEDGASAARWVVRNRLSPVIGDELLSQLQCGDPQAPARVIAVLNTDIS